MMAGSLRRNAFWQLLLTLFTTGTELLIILALAATLESEEFGRYVVVLSLSKAVFLIFEGRLHEFLTPKLSRYLGRNTYGVWMWTRWSMRTEMLLNLTGFIACCGIATVASTISPQIETQMLLAAAAYNGANTFLKFSSLAILRCLDEIRTAAYVSIVTCAFRLGGLVLASQAGWGLPALLLTLATMSLIASSIQAYIAISYLTRRAGAAPRLAYRTLRHSNLKVQLSLLASNYATGIVELMHRELDVQIAALLGGAEAAGRYRLAKTMAMTVLEALNPVVLMLLPDLSRRLVSDADEAIALFLQRVSRALAVIALAMSIVVLLSTMAYLRWVAPQQAQVLLPMALLIGIFTALSPWMWCQAFLVASGKPQAYFKSSAVGAMLACASAFLLVPIAGVSGSVMAYGLGLVVTTILARSAVRRALKLKAQGTL
jgi:O-antigen/teichoic acid export membrane protein